MSETPILVTGATGAQGGAVIDALLAAGLPARALVRTPGSEVSVKLAKRGVELALGDFDDAASLAAAMRGVRAVFSMQNPPAASDPDSELRAGRNLVEAARTAGVDTFVHTSVARAGDQASFAGWEDGLWSRDYWNAKSGVNDLVRAAGFSHWIVLKPAYMMDNFLPPKVGFMHPSLGRDGVIETAMAATTRLDLIAAVDIGRVAAAAFVDPARFDRQEIDLAADALTAGEIAASISRATGRPLTAGHLTAEEAVSRGNLPGLVSNQLWCNVEGYRVDLARAGSLGVTLTPFAAWAERHADAFVIGSR